MAENIGEKMRRERAEICGDLWPTGTSKLSTLEIFERLLMCIGNYREAEVYHARYPKNKDTYMKEWSAWQNAARIYEDALRVRLGGEGEGMADVDYKEG